MSVISCSVSQFIFCPKKKHAFYQNTCLWVDSLFWTQEPLSHFCEKFKKWGPSRHYADRGCNYFQLEGHSSLQLIDGFWWEDWQAPTVQHECGPNPHDADRQCHPFWPEGSLWLQLIDGFPLEGYASLISSRKCGLEGRRVSKESPSSKDGSCWFCWAIGGCSIAGKGARGGPAPAAKDGTPAGSAPAVKEPRWLWWWSNTGNVAAKPGGAVPPWWRSKELNWGNTYRDWFVWLYNSFFVCRLSQIRAVAQACAQLDDTVEYSTW